MHLTESHWAWLKEGARGNKLLCRYVGLQTILLFKTAVKFLSDSGW